jgi:membrane associated rhomboid family serine protease
MWVLPLNKTNMLIILCVFVSLFVWSLQSDEITDLLVFRGIDFFQGKFWTAVTAIFVHGNLVHLIGNMLFLYVFGNTLEDEFGSNRTLGVFFMGGILSFILGAFFYGLETEMVGASAAIFTLMAIVMLTKPLKFSWLFFMPLGLVALLYILFNMAAIYYEVSGNVGYLAHVIGFVIGFPVGISWSRGKWIRNLLITIAILLVYSLVMVFLASILDLSM